MMHPPRWTSNSKRNRFNHNNLETSQFLTFPQTVNPSGIAILSPSMNDNRKLLRWSTARIFSTQRVTAGVRHKHFLVAETKQRLEELRIHEAHLLTFFRKIWIWCDLQCCAEQPKNHQGTKWWPKNQRKTPYSLRIALYSTEWSQLSASKRRKITSDFQLFGNASTTTNF